MTRWTAILCAWLLCASARGDILPGAGGPSIAGAGGAKGESHAWVALPLTPLTDGAAIVHLPPRRAAGREDSIADAEDGGLRLALRLPKMPDRLAAWDNRLWIAFGPESAGGKRVRRVLTMSVERGPLGGSWTSPESEGRLPSLASLPGEGELVGFVGTSCGPLALLRSDDSKRELSLLLNAGAGWIRLAWPPSTGGGWASQDRARWYLLARPNGVSLVALGAANGVEWAGEFVKGGLPADPASGSPAEALTWSRTGLNVQGRAGALAATPSSQVIIAGGEIVCSAQDAGSAVELWNPAAGSCRLLCRLTGVHRPFALVPLDQVGRVAMVWEEEQTPLASGASPGLRTHIVEVSAFSGAVLYDGPARVGGPVSAAELKLLAIAMVGVMAVVLLIVLRPDATATSLSLPKGLALAEPGRRVVAGAIDLLIALGCAAWFRHVPLQQLVAPAVLLYDPDGVETLLLVLGFGIAHSTLGDGFLGRSVGKLVTRCEVVRVRMIASGGEVVPVAARPGFWRALVRNVVRWALAPLAISGLNGPDHRHRGDLAAGTVVVIRVRDQPKDG